MLSSLYSGISGLISNSDTINVVGNNIANVNTVGFKSSRATFEDVLYQSVYASSGTAQVGRGSALASVDTLFSQGSFESTSVSTDLAIGGQGFFIVKTPGSDTNYYTRAGEFKFDKNGLMTNPDGYALQGKMIDRVTNTAYGVDTDIVISPEPSQPKMTEQVEMSVNLQSDAAWKGTVGVLSNVGNNVTAVGASNGQYPRTGDYTAAITNNTAATITHTGTNVPTFNMNGSININGVDITLTGISNIAGLVAAINGQTAATNVKAADDGTGKLKLTANVDGTDVIIQDTGLSSGNTGWTDADKASTDLYGSSMNLEVLMTLPDLSTVTKTYTGLVSSHRGILTNWANSGLDFTLADPTGYVLQATNVANPAETFSINGFQVQNVNATTTPSTTSNYSSSITVYDSLGQSHVVTVYFRKAYQDVLGDTQKNVWEWHATLDGADSATGQDQDVKWGYLTFNNNGVLIAGGDAQTVPFNFSQGAMAGQTIQLVFGANSGGGTTTQYPIASKTNSQTQDGYPPGTLESTAVSDTGVISGNYSNGQILDLYQITLANFNNPEGLERKGGNLFSQTIASGNPYTNVAGQSGLGQINPNSLEQSNVDLATEFVKLIVAQRGYQANSKVITTTDEILQELMNIKR
jgi:flagellar hook protein FlgE